MPSRPKTNRKRETRNRSRRTRCRLCGERESVSVHKKDIRFIEPAGPPPPFEPPKPIFRRSATRTRNRKPGTGNAIRPLDPRASRPKTQDSRQETGNRTRETAVSREDFLRTGTGLGGALFAAAVALGKKKKKK